MCQWYCSPHINKLPRNCKIQIPERNYKPPAPVIAKSNLPKRKKIMNFYYWPVHYWLRPLEFQLTVPDTLYYGGSVHILGGVGRVGGEGGFLIMRLRLSL